jgi:glycogen synthase kinase 3 beta
VQYLLRVLMSSASLGNGGVGSSRSVNGFKSSSSSVDWLGREMLEMRLRDKVDHDEDRVSCHVVEDAVLNYSELSFFCCC